MGGFYTGLLVSFLKYVCICLHWVLVVILIFTCGMWDLVPQPGTEPGTLQRGVRSLSRWTTREVPGFSFLILHPGESVSVTKHTDAIPDPRAVNQDKKNMLFSVSAL